MSKKFTYEFIFNYFKENNCELLEYEYQNGKIPMSYKCKCGNISKISFDSFKRGTRCQKCCDKNLSEKFKFTFEYVFNYFKEHSCELLETDYIKNSTKMKYRCSCKNISYISFSSFKNGSRCKQCGIDKRAKTQSLPFEVVSKYINKYKDYKLISDINTYKNTTSKLEIKCPLNHIFKSSFNTFKAGHRCRECQRLNMIGDKHPRFKKDRTRQTRSIYLRFNLDNIDILKDELLYKNYIQSQQEAKESNKDWDTTKYAVDHIYPRIAFIDNDLDKIYEQTVIKEICNLRENLRIIHQKENSIKNSNYIQEEFINWFNKKLEEYNVC